MSFYPKISYPIGGKLVQGGLPVEGQLLVFNAVTNQWEFDVVPPSGNTFARVVKKVDEIVNNSGVKQSDDELFVNLNINKAYGFLEMIIFNTSTVADFQYNHSIPSGATGSRNNGTWSSLVPTPVVNIINVNQVQAAGGDEMLIIAGKVEMGGTAGRLQFRWAQTLSTAINTVVRKGSYLIVWEELS